MSSAWSSYPLNHARIRLTQACPLLLLLLWMSLLAPTLRAQCSDGGPAPDGKVRDHGVALGDMTQSSRSGLLDYVSDNIDPNLAAEIEADTDPVNGCATLCECYNKDGTHDATTIAVRSLDTPLWYSALVLIHEYEHWRRSRAAARVSGDPYQGDPLTADSNPCGACEHAGMSGRGMALVSETMCLALNTQERNELCEYARKLRKELAEHLVKCRYAGCPACCGYTYVPNVDQIWSLPPCCP